MTCRTCHHFRRGERLTWAGLCRLMGKRADGTPLLISANARRCYFAVSRWVQAADTTTNEARTA